MKYKYFLILFLAVSIGLGHITFADDTDIAGSMRPSWMDTIPNADLFLSPDATQEELDTLIDSEQRLAEIEQSYKKNRELLSETRNDVESQIANIDQIQSQIQENISLNIQAKESLEQDLIFLEKKQEEIKMRQEETKKYIKKILVENYLAEENDIRDTSIFGMLLGSSFEKEATQSGSDSTMKSSMQLLERQKSLEEELAYLKKIAEKKLQTKYAILLRLKDDEEELRESYDLKNQILRKTLTEQSIQRKVAKIEIKKTSLTKKIEIKFAEFEKSLQLKAKEYSCDTSRTALCIWIQKYIEAEKNLMTDDVQFGIPAWPVQPTSGFGYHFRDQKYYTEFTQHHEWLDILSDVGMPVKSLGNGYILFKQNPRQNQAGLVVIKHPEGKLSVYMGVIPGDIQIFGRIQSGDIIGTSHTYLDHSGKNNVHVELYQYSLATDPMEILDTSGLSANVIPARYGWKYVDDLKKAKKSVDISSLQKTIGFFYIEWETEAERQEKMLWTYASNDFQDRTLWVEESIAESIDPTFVLCVGFAESTLGKHLTTDGNIGNVGNTDSGARRDYDDTRSGIRAISAVVNNTWLGGYMTIDQLSGWGNPRWPIYASSRTNWHENITKCMSALKGRYVGHKSNFRLSKAGLLVYEQEGFSREVSAGQDV